MAIKEEKRENILCKVCGYDINYGPLDISNNSTVQCPCCMNDVIVEPQKTNRLCQILK